jgi:hypothetical protein
MKLQNKEMASLTSTMLILNRNWHFPNRTNGQSPKISSLLQHKQLLTQTLRGAAVTSTGSSARESHKGSIAPRAALGAKFSGGPDSRLERRRS